MQEVSINHDVLKQACSSWKERKQKQNKSFKHPLTEFLTESGLIHKNIRGGICNLWLSDPVRFMRARLIYGF